MNLQECFQAIFSEMMGKPTLSNILEIKITITSNMHSMYTFTGVTTAMIAGQGTAMCEILVPTNLASFLDRAMMACEAHPTSRVSYGDGLTRCTYMLHDYEKFGQDIEKLAKLHMDKEFYQVIDSVLEKP